MIEVKVITKKPPRLYRMVGRMQRDSRAIKEAADHMFEGIEPPVDTGNLQSKLRVERVAHNNYRIISGADYSRYVEFGTSNTPPNPYMRRAFRLRKKSARLKYIKAIRRLKR